MGSDTPALGTGELVELKFEITLGNICLGSVWGSSVILAAIWASNTYIHSVNSSPSPFLCVTHGHHQHHSLPGTLSCHTRPRLFRECTIIIWLVLESFFSRLTLCPAPACLERLLMPPFNSWRLCFTFLFFSFLNMVFLWTIWEFHILHHDHLYFQVLPGLFPNSCAFPTKKKDLKIQVQIVLSQEHIVKVLVVNPLKKTESFLQTQDPTSPFLLVHLHSHATSVHPQKPSLPRTPQQQHSLRI